MTAAWHHYRVHGLLLASNRPLPCITADPTQPVDFTVEFAEGQALSPMPAGAAYSPHGVARYWRDEEGLEHARFTDPLDGAQLDFAIQVASRHVTITWAGNTVAEDIPPVLLGSIAGRLLRLRGSIALHANAVIVEGGAVLVCGVSGAGKSTTTACLVAAGYPLLSDDIAALAFAGGIVLARHGQPHLRLVPDSASHLGAEWRNLPTVFQRQMRQENKQRRDLSDEPALFHPEDAPLRAIYLLSARGQGTTSPEFITLPSHKALPELLRNLYIGEDHRRLDMATYLPALARVASFCPVVRVHMPDGLEHLSASALALAAHAAGLPAQSTSQHESALSGPGQ